MHIELDRHYFARLCCGEFFPLAQAAVVAGDVRLQDGYCIGSGAVIDQGNLTKELEIGGSVVISSGSVITNNCEENAVYVDVLAKRIK